MRRLATLRHPGAPETGSEVLRVAARGVVRRGSEVLRLAYPGGLKLPGGRVGEGETDEHALVRELAEEAGATTPTRSRTSSASRTWTHRELLVLDSL